MKILQLNKLFKQQVLSCCLSLISIEFFIAFQYSFHQSNSSFFKILCKNIKIMSHIILIGIPIQISIFTYISTTFKYYHLVTSIKRADAPQSPKKFQTNRSGYPESSDSVAFMTEPSIYGGFAIIWTAFIDIIPFQYF